MYHQSPWIICHLSLTLLRLIIVDSSWLCVIRMVVLCFCISSSVYLIKIFLNQTTIWSSLEWKWKLKATPDHVSLLLMACFLLGPDYQEDHETTSEQKPHKLSMYYLTSPQSNKSADDFEAKNARSLSARFECYTLPIDGYFQNFGRASGGLTSQNFYFDLYSGFRFNTVFEKWVVYLYTDRVFTRLFKGRPES